VSEDISFDLGGDEMSDEEKASIVNSLVDEMRILFHDYVNNKLPYDELSFEMFDTLQTIHALATGALVIEYEDGFEDSADNNHHAEQPASQPKKGSRHDGN